MKKLFLVAAVIALMCTAGAAGAFVWSGETTSSSWTTMVRNTSVVFDPNGVGATVTGWIDVSGLSTGEVLMFGLIDKRAQDQNWYTWQSGAYAYIGRVNKKGVDSLKIGPSDGNNPAGEIINQAITRPWADVEANHLDFTLVVSNQSIELTYGGITKTQAYGTTKTWGNADAYTWDEFADGAYLGFDLYAAPDADKPVSFDISATPEPTAAVPEPMSVLLGIMGLSSIAGFRKLRRK